MSKKGVDINILDLSKDSYETDTDLCIFCK